MKIKKINSIEDMNRYLSGKRVIVFGAGAYFELYVKEQLAENVIQNIDYFIDNGDSTAYLCDGKEVKVYKPFVIEKEADCVVLLASINYMYDMYEQLMGLNIADTVECIAYPLVMISARKEIPEESIPRVFSGEQKIEKKIHSFWFSGDKKPLSYQKCIDSWREKCPDYEMIEWNMDNYDYTKNPFMKKAIECKKWAFASDYARLDVVWQYGGIYMDMDVELMQSPDSLLSTDAFFTFDSSNDIDLEMFGSVPQNPILKEMMDLYADAQFDGTNDCMSFYCQPRYIREVLKKRSVKLNGEFQESDRMIFLPRKYLSPIDAVIYEMTDIEKETIAVHHFNAGWRDGGYKQNRIENNRKLYNIFKNNGDNNAK